MQRVSECELVVFFGPPPAEGGRRPYAKAAASALWALAAAVRPRPPAGRARPSPLHTKKALASKWYYMRAEITPPFVKFGGKRCSAETAVGSA